MLEYIKLCQVKGRYEHKHARVVCIFRETNDCDASTGFYADPARPL